jgi:hypothetical protein
MTLDDVFPAANLIAVKNGAADAELRDCVAEVNGSIQRIQDLVGRESVDAARIRFPRGYLREISRWRSALGFVRSNQVRNMVADTLMLHDVQAWVLKRTDLSGHAKDMLTKGTIGTLGGIAEALLIDATSPPMGNRQKIASRVQRLKDGSVLDSQLCDDLSWLWDIRNRQHLHSLGAREFDFYTLDDHPRAEGTVARLVQALKRPTATSA